MSVRVNDRKQSRMEYINNAQAIVYIAQERINKYINKLVSKKKYKTLTKSSQYSVWHAPIYHSQQLYNYCILANKMRDTNIRLEYLDKASQTLNLLECSLETFYNSFKDVIKDKFIILITSKIDYQKLLLDGCIKKFRNVD